MDGMFLAQTRANDSTAPYSDAAHGQCVPRSKEWWEHNTSTKRIKTSNQFLFQSPKCFHGSSTCWAEVGACVPQGLSFLSFWLKWASSKTNAQIRLPADVLKWCAVRLSFLDWKTRNTSFCNACCHPIYWEPLKKKRFHSFSCILKLQYN